MSVMTSDMLLPSLFRGLINQSTDSPPDTNAPQPYAIASGSGDWPHPNRRRRRRLAERRIRDARFLER